MRWAKVAVIAACLHWPGRAAARDGYLTCAKYLTTMRELHLDPERSDARTDDALKELRSIRRALGEPATPRERRARARLDEIVADVRRDEVRTYGVVTYGRAKILNALARRERLASAQAGRLGERSADVRAWFVKPAEAKLRAALERGEWSRQAFDVEASVASLRAIWSGGGPSAEGRRHFATGAAEPTGVVRVDEFLIADPAATPRFITLLRWMDQPYPDRGRSGGSSGERDFDWRALIPVPSPRLVPVPVRAGGRRYFSATPFSSSK